jgi:glycosyltransferase involved in cell wall biosynthesis
MNKILNNNYIKNPPLATCICATYNRPKLLKELLFCFLAQDYSNKELIIINDQETIEYYFDNPSVTIYNLKERFISLGMKRNFTKDKIKGEFVFFMDDDDIYYSNHLSRHIKHHLENNEYDIITNKNCDFSENNENIIKKFINVPFNGVCIKAEYVKSHYFPHYVSCGEDKSFIEDAKIFVMKDDIPTFHYRWEMNVWNISGFGGAGTELYSNIFSVQEHNEFKKIILIPELSEKTKLYYK